MSNQHGQGLDPQPAKPEPAFPPVWRGRRDASSAGDAARGNEGMKLGLKHRLFIRLAHLWFRLIRGMTLGVRVMAFDRKGRLFLVRHTYVPGWHLPGGGIEVGQDALQAARAELAQEGNIALDVEPELFGIYLNLSASRRDHVVLYVARDVVQSGPRASDHEIAESGFFVLDNLPETTTLGTLRRLDEVLGGKPPAPHW